MRLNTSIAGAVLAAVGLTMPLGAHAQSTTLEISADDAALLAATVTQHTPGMRLAQPDSNVLVLYDSADKQAAPAFYKVDLRDASGAYSGYAIVRAKIEPGQSAIVEMGGREADVGESIEHLQTMLKSDAKRLLRDTVPAMSKFASNKLLPITREWWALSEQLSTSPQLPLLARIAKPEQRAEVFCGTDPACAVLFAHASGCGPTAWFNLATYWDTEMSPGLVGAWNVWANPIKSAYNFVPEVVIAQEYLREELGTFGVPLSTQSATLPGDMYWGPVYLEDALGYKIIEPYVADPGLPYVDIYGGALIDEGKPIIIGYWDDVHYDVVTALREVVSLIPGTASSWYGYVRARDKWIEQDDWFFAHTFVDVTPSGNRVVDGSFELGEWSLTQPPQSAGYRKFAVATRRKEAKHGTAMLELTKVPGDIPYVATAQREFHAGLPGTYTLKYSVWMSGFAAGSSVRAMVRNTDTGAILANQFIGNTYGGTGGNWQPKTVQFQVTTGGFEEDLEVSFTLGAAYAEAATIRVDQVEIMRQ